MMESKKKTYQSYKYKIHVTIEDREELLNCYKELCLNGFGLYSEFHYMSYGIDIEGICFNKYRFNECLKLLEKYNIDYMVKKRIKIDSEIETLTVKDEMKGGMD
jgi:hypothetical protein